MDKYAALLSTPDVGFIALLGGVSGGAIGAIPGGVTWWLGVRDNVARHLLTEAMRIQALMEAWVVVGREAVLYELKPSMRLPVRQVFFRRWGARASLCRVEGCP